MKRTTIYKIRVTGSLVTDIYEGYFLQLPNHNELREDITSEIEAAEKRAIENEDGDGDYHQDTANGLKHLTEVVCHSETLVAPISGEASVRVVIADVEVGTVTVETINARSRDAQQALQELCA